MAAENVILRTDDENWQGWTSCEITRQLDAISGSFSLGLTRQVEAGGKMLALRPGMPCEILAGDAPIINGYVNTLSDSGAQASHSITVSGRDKSGDLVDCSAVQSPGQWSGFTVFDLAARLSAPFGVPVYLEGDPGPAFSAFKLEQGETVHEALDRALRQRELFALPSGDGGIVIAAIGFKTCATAIVYGENVLSWAWSANEQDRFSDYFVEGQQAGTDDSFGLEACSVRGNANDERVERYRPLIVRAENQVNRDTAARRAAWEKTVRAGRAVTLEVTLQGWRQESGELWDVNALVDVAFPYFALEGPLLISKVVYQQSRDAGTTCRLTLSPKDAFTPEPEEIKQAAQEKTSISGGNSGDVWGDIEEAV